MYEFEEWRPIKGYEGLYEISNYGRVKSLYRIVERNSVKGKVQHRNEHISVGSGKTYLKVKLYKGDKKSSKRVHILVAEAFIPNKWKLPEVNHKDENVKNNCVWNLEWCTRSYNESYGTRTDRIIKSRNENNSYGSEKPVLQLTKEGELINSFKSVEEASRQTGICDVAIRNVCNNKPHYKTAGGCFWKYAA